MFVRLNTRLSKVAARATVSAASRCVNVSASSVGVRIASAMPARAMSGDAHGHGHAEALPTPRIKSWEDTYATNPPLQSEDSRTIGTQASHEAKWSSILNQYKRKSPFPYTDARNANWLLEIPSNLPSRPMYEASRKEWTSFGSMAGAVVLLVGGVVAAVAYNENKKEFQFMKPVVGAAAASGLDSKEFKSFKLIDIRPYNHNTKQFVFELASPTAKLDLPTASFVVVKAGVKSEDGKDVIRPYTPIDQHVTGQIHLLVKKYPTGLMGNYLFNLKLGDSVSIKGPIQKIAYTPNMKKQIGMIAGGTGITPMLQVIDQVLSDPKDKTQLTLLFANDTESDILLKERLDELQSRYPAQFKVHYVLAKPGPAWTGASGFVNEALISKYMPKPEKDSLVFVCGPPPMMKALSGEKVKSPSGAMEQGPVEGALKALNYSSETVFKF